MPAPSDAPLRRVNLNLYEADCKTMEKRYGRGWTERVRRMLQDECNKWRKVLWDEETSLKDKYTKAWCHNCDKVTSIRPEPRLDGTNIICRDCYNVIATLLER